MAEIPALSFAFTADATGWFTPTYSDLWITPEQKYKNHPIVNPPRVELQTEPEWVRQTFGLLVRSDLPIIDADTGPKVLTNELPLIEIGARMGERSSGLFAPPAPSPFLLLKSAIDDFGSALTYSFTMAIDSMNLAIKDFTVGKPTISGTLDSLVPMLGTASAVCPAKGCERAKPKKLKETIIHLNDHHHWTRESIADWLDTLDIDLTVQRKEPDANHPIRGAKFDQVIYDEIVGFDPAPLAAAN